MFECFKFKGRLSHFVWINATADQLVFGCANDFGARNHV